VIAGTILIVEDDRSQSDALAGALRQLGQSTLTAAGVDEALSLLAAQPVDLVLTDLRLPGRSGLALLDECRQQWPDTSVVLMTAYGTIDGAVAAMKQGAVDFVGKPLDLDQLELVLERALTMRRLVHENRELRRRLADPVATAQLRGDSAAMAEVLAWAERAADTDATVLIHGESGTGKELLARAIHEMSRRGCGPFVAVDCASLSEDLLESEMFGHVRGAFTGADSDRGGRVLQAQGGTLFLDGIGDLTGAAQIRLLRFLQEREITPVGGDRAVPVDVRVVAATHGDLRERIAAGRFREDLYFRLNVVELALPPLRGRREDIPELAAHFLARYARRHARPARAFSAEAMTLLMAYPYPGNVRELENIVEQAVVLARGEVVRREDLPLARLDPARRSEPNGGNLAATVEAFEQRLVLDALAACGGNQSEAARRLGLTESGLRYKLAKWRDG
jgi:DNA-binding NtrC family response regulator